jgi:hypothetical protein
MLAPWHSASSPIAKGSGIKGRITDLEAFRVSTNKENEKSGVKVMRLAFLMVPVIKDADKKGIMQPVWDGKAFQPRFALKTNKR